MTRRQAIAVNLLKPRPSLLIGWGYTMADALVAVSCKPLAECVAVYWRHHRHISTVGTYDWPTSSFLTHREEWPISSVYFHVVVIMFLLFKGL